MKPKNNCVPINRVKRWSAKKITAYIGVMKRARIWHTAQNGSNNSERTSVLRVTNDTINDHQIQYTVRLVL